MLKFLFNRFGGRLCKINILGKDFMIPVEHFFSNEHFGASAMLFIYLYIHVYIE